MLFAFPWQLAECRKREESEYKFNSMKYILVILNLNECIHLNHLPPEFSHFNDYVVPKGTIQNSEFETNQLPRIILGRGRKFEQRASAR